MEEKTFLGKQKLREMVSGIPPLQKLLKEVFQRQGNLDIYKKGRVSENDKCKENKIFSFFLFLMALRDNCSK